MKTVIVIRHAKSSWSEPGMADSDRPLNDRGKKDAPVMAKRLRKSGIRIDLFLSSTAKRTRTTARYFAEEYGITKKAIILEEKLYGAAQEVFYSVLAVLPDAYQSVAVFGHNPGITDFVNTLSGMRVDNMPTGAMFAVKADTNSWASFKEAAKDFLFFDYPKKLADD